MQFRGQFSDFFFETMLPALNAKIWQTFNMKKPMAKLVLDGMTTTRSIEQFSMMAGVGLPTAVGEGEDTPVDSFVQGFHTTFKPVKFGLGIAASQELVEDDKVGIVTKRSVALSESIYQAREIQGASVFNNAFSSTDGNGNSTNLSDGYPLISASHPLVKTGGTQSNQIAVAADLDVASLEVALTDWELLKDHRGFFQLLPKPRVLVASQNRWNVAEILKSQMRSDTANNTRNAFQDTEQGGSVESLCWGGFLTDPDAWFLVAPPAQTEMVWLDRKAPYTKSDYVEKNETGFIYLRYRATYGAYGWKGVYGSAGA
jgi:hypothetical protein